MKDKEIGWWLLSIPIFTWFFSDLRLVFMGIIGPIVWMWIIGILMYSYGSYLILFKENERLGEMRSMSKGKYYCSKCGKSFFNGSALGGHMGSHRVKE